MKKDRKKKPVPTSKQGLDPQPIDPEVQKLLDEIDVFLFIGLDNQEKARCVVLESFPETPVQTGIVLADVLRHLARAHSNVHGVSAEQATIEIWNALVHEMKQPTDTIQEF